MNTKESYSWDLLSDMSFCYSTRLFKISIPWSKSAVKICSNDIWQFSLKSLRKSDSIVSSIINSSIKFYIYVFRGSMLVDIAML